MRMKLSVLFLAVAGLAVGQPVGSAADKPPLSLTISGPQTVRAGEQVLIRRVLTNLSNQPIQIFIGTKPVIIVHDENGKKVPQTADGWDGSFGFVTIDPGKSAGDTFVDLTRECDLSKPGKYIVQLQRRLDDADPKSPLLVSNTFTITIVAAAKS